MRGGGKTLHLLTALLLLSTLATPVFSRTDPPGPLPPRPSQYAPQSSGQPEGSGEFTVRGCLSGTEYLLTPERDYRLTGDTTALRSYNGKYVAIRVRKAPKRIPPMTDITVEFIRLEGVLPRPLSILDPSVSDSSLWHGHRSTKYGVRFAVPVSFAAAAVSRVFADPEFANPQGAVTLGSFTIPEDTYSRASFTTPSGYHPTVFAGGSFAIFVNPGITNRPSCLQFANPYPGTLSWRTIGGVRYRESTWGGAAGGTGYDSYTFHTFQNGFCYAITLEMAQVNTGIIDGGCMLPVVTPQQERDLIQRLLPKVAFSRPGIAPARPKASSSIPVVVSFTAASHLAENVFSFPGRGAITFSWSARNTDYVQLSCRYPSARTRFRALAGDGKRQNEGSSFSPSRPCQAGTLDYPPSGSTAVFFSNRQDNPITVPVTLTPFFQGAAYPAAGKTIAITVTRYNPWPEGVPTETKNVTVLSPVAGNGPLTYKQGSQLTVRWTDSLKSDSCVNLYLVQDRAGAAPTYLTQINRGYGCVSPASSGSFTWTIPQKYSGTGFRILLSPPGTDSNALTPPFRIVP
jgi:hypothetical protein